MARTKSVRPTLGGLYVCLGESDYRSGNGVGDLRSPKVWTFTSAIYMAMGGSDAAGPQYGSAMASAVMASLPTVLVFLPSSRDLSNKAWFGVA